MYIRPRIIPVLLIDDRDMIKTVQFNERTYLGDVVNAVKIFNRKRIDELSILDIGATVNNREPDYELLKDIATEAFMPLSYGGGIKNIEQIKKLLSIGFEKVIINSEIINNPSLIKEAVSIFGSQSIVASIDAKKEKDGNYSCYTCSGTEKISYNPVEYAKYCESLGVGEIIINSIDNDGMMKGYDIELISKVTRSVNVPVIAIGGAGKIDDFKQALNEGHAHAVAGGSIFVYYGRLKAVLITVPSEKELFEKEIYK